MGVYDFRGEYWEYWEVPGSYDSRVESVCICIDGCVDLYLLVGIAVLCMEAWGFDVLW